MWLHKECQHCWDTLLTILAHIVLSLGILEDVLPPELAFFVSVIVPGFLQRQQWVFAICR